MRRAAFAGFILSVFLLGFAAGCSSDKGNPYSPGGGGGNPGANEVWIQNMAFNPSNRAVSVNTTITWTNKDAATHTVTGTGWGSGNLTTNQTYSHTFDTAGSFPYHCTIHPSMTATIAVQ
jgi:plastocyanin